MLKRELNRKIKNSEEFIFAFERLSAPEDLSFYQEEELDLLRIKKYEKKHEKLKNMREFEKRILEHQKKYCWLLNSYHDTKVLSTNHFKKELSSISLKEAEEKIKKIENWKKYVLEEKKKIIKRYELGKEIEKISHLLGFCIWWQDQRKKYIFMANHCIDVFLKETSMRFNVDFEELHYYRASEVIDVVRRNKKIPEEERKKRMRHFMHNYYEKENAGKVFSGKKAAEMIAPYIAVKVDPNLKEISGMVVSRGSTGSGIVKAKAKILASPKEINKMNQGDILVASMTSPDYIVAMRKASAIITDEGGMTCHAAIVSRELGIPCIVGTKIATKVLKDNDVIEVNANHGTVRIIRK